MESKFSVNYIFREIILIKQISINVCCKNNILTYFSPNLLSKEKIYFPRGILTL